MGLEYRDIRGSIQTTDATKTPLVDVVIPNNAQTTIKIAIVAVGSTNSDQLRAEFIIVVDKLAGTELQVGTTSLVSWSNAGGASFVIGVDAVIEAGEDILRFSGTGAVGKTVDWFPDAVVTRFFKP